MVRTAVTDEALLQRVGALRTQLGRWPAARDAVAHDPALLGMANDGGATFHELVMDARRAAGEDIPDPPLTRGRWALVLGGADCVKADIEAVESMVDRKWPGLVIAANDIGCQWPRKLDHWVTLHPEKLPKWEALRTELGYPDGYMRWSRRNPEKVERTIRPWGGGASGLLAVAVAYEVGCAKIVLAGMPMDSRPHFDESTEHRAGRKWTSFRKHRKAWERKMDRIRQRTRSMSGWTSEHLGEPTFEWLHDTETREAA